MTASLIALLALLVCLLAFLACLAIAAVRERRCGVDAAWPFVLFGVTFAGGALLFGTLLSLNGRPAG